MGRLDKSYVHNAGARDPSKPRVTFYSGKNRKNPNGPPERRQQLWPSGTVERFVNLQGAVVQIPLIPPGVPATPEGIGSARAKLHRVKSSDGEIQGFIEHAECPLLNGNSRLSETLRDEFAKMPRELLDPCAEDPVTFRKTKKGIEYFDSCPHIQWLIESRRARHRKLTEARTKRHKSSLQMEQEKVDILKQQADATNKILERVADRLEAPVRSRKANTEPSE